MNKCFLNGHGNCGGGVSREHYISETVLRAIAPDGSIQIGGLPWQPDLTLQSIGIGSLVSNILCATHNSKMSPLDAVGGQLARVLDDIDKRPTSLPRNTKLDGLLIERFFLKVLCGLAAGPGLKNSAMSAHWKVLLSGAAWPEAWGLYVPAVAEPQVMVPEFYIETLVHPNTREALAAKFRIAGVRFNLLLGCHNDPGSFGYHRPRGIIVHHEKGENRIEFMWPHETEQAIYFTKIGYTELRPPQWDGWSERAKSTCN